MVPLLILPTRLMSEFFLGLEQHVSIVMSVRLSQNYMPLLGFPCGEAEGVAVGYG